MQDNDTQDMINPLIGMADLVTRLKMDPGAVAFIYTSYLSEKCDPNAEVELVRSEAFEDLSVKIIQRCMGIYTVLTTEQIDHLDKNGLFEAFALDALTGHCAGLAAYTLQKITESSANEAISPSARLAISRFSRAMEQQATLPALDNPEDLLEKISTSVF